MFDDIFQNQNEDKYLKTCKHILDEFKVRWELQTLECSQVEITSGKNFEDIHMTFFPFMWDV